MGGINHAPCSKYLRNSTMVSMYLTLAHAELQFANVAFEETLLSDLDSKPLSPDKIQHKLEQSKNALIDMGRHMSKLKKQMNENQFKDLPTLKTSDLSCLGKHMSDIGMVNSYSWQKMQELMQIKGFYGVLANFTKRVATILALTSKLQKEFEFIYSSFKQGDLNKLLEQNREGNVKPTFAKLFREWNDFLNDFLASSMISTELWYTHSEYGSLLGKLEGLGREQSQPLFSRSHQPHFMVHKNSH